MSRRGILGVRGRRDRDPSSPGRLGWTFLLGRVTKPLLRWKGLAMEGRPGYEVRGATPIRGRVDSSSLTRKRLFLRLDGERRELAAQLCAPWRPRGRYEDLSLALMLARLERDWLSQPGPHRSGGAHPSGRGEQPGRRLADWAMPWGAAPRAKLEADIGHLDGALKRLGRWLPRRSIAMAECNARQRVAAITAQLGELDPRARAALAAVPQGPATDPLPFERPSRTRVAAIAGLFLLAVGAGAFLLAARTGSGPGDSFARPGAAARVQPHPGARDLPAVSRSGRPTQGPDESASRPGNRRGSARASSQGSAQSAPIASEPAPPAPEPAPVAQPVAVPQPAPAPPSSSSSSAPSPAKGAGGCPPEFGYEC